MPYKNLIFNVNEVFHATFLITLSLFFRKADEGLKKFTHENQGESSLVTNKNLMAYGK